LDIESLNIYLQIRFPGIISLKYQYIPMSDESAVLRLTTAAHSDVVIAEDDGNAVYLALRCRLWVSGVEVKIPAAGSGKLVLSLKQPLESGVKEFKIRALSQLHPIAFVFRII